MIRNGVLKKDLLPYKEDCSLDNSMHHLFSSPVSTFCIQKEKESLWMKVASSLNWTAPLTVGLDAWERVYGLDDKDKIHARNALSNDKRTMETFDGNFATQFQHEFKAGVIVLTQTDVIEALLYALDGIPSACFEKDETFVCLRPRDSKYHIKLQYGGISSLQSIFKVRHDLLLLPDDNERCRRNVHPVEQTSSDYKN